MDFLPLWRKRVISWAWREGAAPPVPGKPKLTADVQRLRRQLARARFLLTIEEMEAEDRDRGDALGRGRRLAVLSGLLQLLGRFVAAFGSEPPAALLAWREFEALPTPRRPAALLSGLYRFAAGNQEVLAALHELRLALVEWRVWWHLTYHGGDPWVLDAALRTLGRWAATGPSTGFHFPCRIPPATRRKWLRSPNTGLRWLVEYQLKGVGTDIRDFASQAGEPYEKVRETLETVAERIGLVLR